MRRDVFQAIAGPKGGFMAATILGEMLRDKDPGKSKRVMEAMLKMTKIDIKTLKQAYDQQ
jgi:hypothetical protein